MVTATLDDTYYDRMRAAMGDKMRVLEFTRGTQILDVGCGSGDLVKYLQDTGHQAYGVDISPESVARSRTLTSDSSIFQLYSNEVHELDTKFTSVICSSVLHEVFSYGNADGKIGKLRSISDTIESIHKVMVPGGRLVIRDGLGWSDWSSVNIRVDSIDAVTKFLEASPFAPPRSLSTDRSVSLARRPLTDGGGMYGFRGSMDSVREFAFTYTWGPDSFDREVQEYYGVFDQHNYRRFVERRGFKLIHFTKYIQPDYPKYLAGKVDFSQTIFPHTNAIWVYERI
jgi:SAM-dependent methyltransferase